LGRNRRKWGGLKAKYRRRFKAELKQKEAREQYANRKKKKRK
tara:strand:- start:631 stop:756 length:126 start_codon:yes stop_codon:yes gene_type:complete